MAGASLNGERSFVGEEGAGVVLLLAGRRGRRRLTLSSPPWDGASDVDSVMLSIGDLELGRWRSILRAFKLSLSWEIGEVLVDGRRRGILSGTTSWGSSADSACSKGDLAYSRGLTLRELVGDGDFGKSSVFMRRSAGRGLGRIGGKKSR